MKKVRTNKISKNKDRKIYILLLRTNSVFSRIVHMVTKANYTHASIGVEDSCEEFYSFARRYTRLPLPAGFVGENVNTGLMAKSLNAPCALYELTISEEVYLDIMKEIDQMKQNSHKLQYSCLGTLMCFFHLTYERENHYFCSQFVADVLHRSGALTLDKPASLYHPNDFTQIKELKLCYQGTLKGLRLRSA